MESNHILDDNPSVAENIYSKYELIYRDCGNVVFDLYSFSIGSLRIFNRRSNALNLRNRTRTTGRPAKAQDLLVFYVSSGFESGRAKSGEICRTSHRALPHLS